MGFKDWFFLGLSTLIIAGSLLIADRRNLSPQQYKSLEQRISEEVAKPNGEPDKYAVMISGNGDIRYKQNLSLAYRVLLENGFQRENIYILDDKGNKTASYPIDNSASKEAVKKIFNHLEKKLDSTDLFLVYTTGHGNEKTFSLALPGEDLSAEEMEEYLPKNLKAGIVVSDQCYGGNFAKRTGKGKYIGISASEVGKVSKINTFPQAFFKSLRDNKSFFSRNNKSDVNEDGKVSIEEAFNYAVSNDSFAKKGKQKPQIYSEINASEVFLK